MPAIVLDLLKYVFLAVLYIFVWRAVRAVYRDLKTEAAPRRPAAQPAKRAKKAPKKVAVIEGALKGKAYELADELIIGRADRCHIVLDDTYASQVHARIFPRDASYLVEDMGSTNGTYLNRNRVTSPTELRRGDRIKIGKTVMELRR